MKRQIAKTTRFFGRKTISFFTHVHTHIHTWRDTEAYTCTHEHMNTCTQTETHIHTNTYVHRIYYVMFIWMIDAREQEMDTYLSMYDKQGQHAMNTRSVMICSTSVQCSLKNRTIEPFIHNVIYKWMVLMYWFVWRCFFILLLCGTSPFLSFKFISFHSIDSTLLRMYITIVFSIRFGIMSKTSEQNNSEWPKCDEFIGASSYKNACCHTMTIFDVIESLHTNTHHHHSTAKQQRKNSSLN